MGDDAHATLAGIAAQALQVVVGIGLSEREAVAMLGPVGVPAVVPALDKHAAQAMLGGKIDVALGVLGRGTVALTLRPGPHLFLQGPPDAHILGGLQP